ncbi:MAG: GTPase HflX, partial [Acidithiobacillus ferriphilus]
MLVHVVLQGETDPDDGAEFSHLATDSGAEVLAFLSVQRDRPDPATFLGRGKVVELAEQVSDLSVDLVLFDRVLSPVQERNLERALQCRVVDRVGLILDIFARRAHTHEGKLQVELAQLTRLRTRLIRGWTHLERQRGGIGLRGPGETQLETDRRLIGERIRSLRGRLVKVAAHRATQRRARQRAPLPTVALVGYTNAGKSSLFNALTESSSYAADRLFATLDPAIRRLQIAGHEAILLADTVGFLRDLPTDLIAAFRATLEEVNQAQLLLHVVDGSAPDRDAQIAAVDAVLTEIGADEIPRLLVLNKVDLTGDAPG